jgi:pSer/pThr/pTyr-binding forkhead associated (FHA) protein
MSKPELKHEATRVRVQEKTSGKAPARTSASVVIIKGHAEGMEYLLEKPHNIIGREDTVDVPVKDQLVSRHHAAIVREGGAFVLKDLKSRNGTLFKGARIEQAELRHGDTFTVGDTTIQFILEDREAGNVYVVRES